MSLKRGALPDAWPIALAFAASLVLFVACLSHDIGGGDSGELIVNAKTFSTPHPPGYPLFILVARLSLYLPFAMPAQSVHFLSAVCQAASVALAFAALRTLGASASGAALTSGLCAVHPLCLQWATTADVFALNNLAVALALFCTAKMVCAPSRQMACCAAALCGLALSNHHTFVLYAAIVLPWCLWRLRQGALYRPLVLGQMIGCFALGLLPYLLLVAGLHNDHLLAWGDTHTLSGLARHVLRQEYGTFHLSSGAKGEQMAIFWPLLGLFVQSAMLGSLGAVGLACMAPRRGRCAQAAFVRLWLGCVAFYLVFFFNLADLPLDVPVHREMQARFWLMPLLPLFAMCGLGLSRLETIHLKYRRFVPGATVLLLVACGLGSIRLLTPWQRPIFAAAATNMLHHLPPQSLILTRGEHVLNPLRYLQSCESKRPDVPVLSVELMRASWYGDKVRRAYPRIYLPEGTLGTIDAVHAFTMQNFLKHNMAAGWRVFQCDHNPIVDSSLKHDFNIVSHGLCSEITASPVNVDAASVALDDAATGLLELQAVSGQIYRAQSWEEVMRAQILHAQQALAPQILLKTPIGAPHEHRRISQAIALLDHVRQHAPSQAEVLKNLGVAYGRLFDLTSSPRDKALMRATFVAWLALGKPDADRSAIEHLVNEGA